VRKSFAGMMPNWRLWGEAKRRAKQVVVRSQRNHRKGMRKAKQRRGKIRPRQLSKKKKYHYDPKGFLKGGREKKKKGLCRGNGLLTEDKTRDKNARAANGGKHASPSKGTGDANNRKRGRVGWAPPYRKKRGRPKKKKVRKPSPGLQQEGGAKKQRQGDQRLRIGHLKGKNGKGKTAPCRTSQSPVKMALVRNSADGEEKPQSKKKNPAELPYSTGGILGREVGKGDLPYGGEPENWIKIPQEQREGGRGVHRYSGHGGACLWGKKRQEQNTPHAQKRPAGTLREAYLVEGGGEGGWNITLCW